MAPKNLTERVKARLATERPKQSHSIAVSGRRKTAARPSPDSSAELPPPPSAPRPDAVEAYYDTFKGGFYTRNALGEWQRVEKEMLALELRAAGFYTAYKHANGLSFLENELLRLTKERSVHFAGALGGFPPGRHDVLGTRILVTTGPKFLKPVAGEWRFLRAFILQLLGDQAKYFFAWLKWSLDSLRNGMPWSPGQMLAVAGPPGCGKSFLQSLITPMLGGRVSKPYQYLTGGTSFNAEIFAAEHALIGDEVPRSDAQSRRNLSFSLQNLIANKEQSIHAKGKQQITLTPYLRVTMSLNDTADALMALPSFDSEVGGKIILLRAGPVKFPFPSRKFPSSQEYYRQLLGELPAMLYYLRRWQIPESIRDQRWGVVSYHDPALLLALDELASETVLTDMIDRHLFAAGLIEEWYGTAGELEAALRGADKHGECSRLFSYSTVCGQLLSKLATKRPERFVKVKGHANKSYYKIQRP